MTIHKDKITAPEIVVLKALHGQDAVVQIEPYAEVKRAAKDEFDRLLNLYGKTAVEGCFPGAAPSLPKTLAEAGIELVDEEAPEVESEAEEEIVPLPNAAPRLPASVARRLKPATADSLV